MLRVFNARHLLLAAAAGAILYFAALHPWSGATGGILFLLLGWALPSAFIALLALGLAFLLPAPLLIRLPVAVLLSFLFGMNAMLGELPGLLRYEQQASFQVLTPVSRTADAIRIKRRSWPPLFVQPLAPQLRVGSDEGCGCMYFLEAAIYSDRVRETLRRVSGRYSSVIDYPRTSDPASEQKDVHIDVMFWKNDTEYSTRIEVVDRGKPVARFDQRNLPLFTLVERKGVGREKLAENFWENALHLFARDNAWSAIVGRFVPSYYPETQVEEFFRAAGAGA